MDHPKPKPSERPGTMDFDIHGIVRIRLIDPSPRDLGAACKLFGCPSRRPLTDPHITVRFVENLPVRGMRFWGPDQGGFTDDGFFWLQEGTNRAMARIPFDRIGGPCEIVCKSHLGSVPLLIPIVNLTALKGGCVPVHASAVVYNGVGVLMAGSAHCGKTAALLGFAAKGAEYVGEEWVLLNGNGQTMQGLARPLQLSHWHFANLPHVRSAVKPANRCSFHGISVLYGLLKIISAERTRGSFVFRTLKRALAAVEERLRPTVALSAIFRDRIRSAGAQADKVFLFVTHEEHRTEVEPIAPVEMARHLAFLFQQELT